MARYFSNAKFLSGVLIGEGRGFASAAPQSVVSGAARVGVKSSGAAAMVKKTGEEAAEKVAWVPDPRTGFYRPENVVEEIDVAELRNMLLKKH